MQLAPGLGGQDREVGDVWGRKGPPRGTQWLSGSGLDEEIVGALCRHMSVIHFIRLRIYGTRFCPAKMDHIAEMTLFPKFHVRENVIQRPNNRTKAKKTIYPKTI